MPQQDYVLIEFDWVRSLEKLRGSALVSGDLSDEEIERCRGKLCAYVKVLDDKVSFNLSRRGYLQVSSPNADLLRRAKSQLANLVVCSQWTPSEISKEPSGLRGAAEQPHYKALVLEQVAKVRDLITDGVDEIDVENAMLVLYQMIPEDWKDQQFRVDAGKCFQKVVVDIRPMNCGVKLSKEYCEQHGIPTEEEVTRMDKLALLNACANLFARLKL